MNDTSISLSFVLCCLLTLGACQKTEFEDRIDGISYTETENHIKSKEGNAFSDGENQSKGPSSIRENRIRFGEYQFEGPVFLPTGYLITGFEKFNPPPSPFFSYPYGALRLIGPSIDGDHFWRLTSPNTVDQIGPTSYTYIKITQIQDGPGSKKDYVTIRGGSSSCFYFCDPPNPIDEFWGGKAFFVD